MCTHFVRQARSIAMRVGLRLIAVPNYAFSTSPIGCLEDPPLSDLFSASTDKLLFAFEDVL